MTKFYHMNRKKSMKKVAPFNIFFYNNNMIYQVIQKKLFSHQDLKYREFMLKSIPNEKDLIGVRMPILKRIATDLLRSKDAHSYLLAQPKFHEEKILQALLSAQLFSSFDQISLVRAFIPKITNWAVCDTFCTYLKQVQYNLSEFFNFIEPYLSSEKEFEVRVGLVLLLSYYINQEYLSHLFKILDKFHHQGYYAKMAAAWLLSLCYLKYPKKTKEYLAVSKLDQDTFNKGIQKIIESNLTLKSDYVFLKSLKKH